MALHFVFHFCAVRALFLTPHSLCYRILFSKLAVQHFNTAYSEDNGTKVMAFPLHCSNEKESYTSGTLMHCFWQGGKREKRIGAKTTRKRAHLLLGSGAH
jgi:hypothetical protein